MASVGADAAGAAVVVAITPSSDAVSTGSVTHVTLPPDAGAQAPAGRMFWLSRKTFSGS